MSIDTTKLGAPFPPEKIHWRVGATTKDKKKGLALAYIDARDVMERLDEVCGPENWQRRYVDAGNGRTCCEVGIRFGDWIWKSDGAGDTDVEADKGAFSDAFKRAAVNWGVGRYLYDVEAPWLELDTNTVNGKTYVNGFKKSELPKLRKCLSGGQPAAPASKSAADTYVEMALPIISKFTSDTGISTWWENEAAHRRENGLTNDHVETLKNAIAEQRATFTESAAA